MPLTIESVPENIPLSAVTAFLESLGVTPRCCRRLTVGLDSVELEVLAIEADGRAVVVDNGDGPKIGVHQLTLRINLDA